MSIHHKKNFDLSNNVADTLTKQQQNKIKEQILTKSKAASTRSIKDAIVIKELNLFFLTEPDAQIPTNDHHALGMYYNDCRFLSGYQFLINNKEPHVLMNSSSKCYKAIFELTNPEIEEKDFSVSDDHFGIKLERTLSNKELALYDQFIFQNYTQKTISFSFKLSFDASFQDVYTVRGLLKNPHGNLIKKPTWEEDGLHYIYLGVDGIFRGVKIVSSEHPQKIENEIFEFNLNLKPLGKTQLRISVLIDQSDTQDQLFKNKNNFPDLKKIELSVDQTYKEWFQNITSIDTDCESLHNVLSRSLHDIHLLRYQIKDDLFIAAGVPWFTTLFGRDCAITTLQSMMLNPNITKESLHILCDYQGKKIDQWLEEEPGKILHELRIGEFARSGAIPYTPYYGSVDSTMMFLILIGHYIDWTGDISLFDEYKDSIEAALLWIDQYANKNKDGFLEYNSNLDSGYINKGWKDSGSAIVNKDGSLAKPPIALVEVQGFVYMAKKYMAKLYDHIGDSEKASQLNKESEQLKERFNNTFWMEDQDFFMMGLQSNNEPISVISSNPGQALWTGIIDEKYIVKTVKRLMQPDLFNGWGIRTLSSEEKSYNPFSYHTGSVWPHDNALIASGLRQNGFVKECKDIIQGIYQSAGFFSHYRIPELLSGCQREQYGRPVRYPVACHPQAWGAGSVIYMLKEMLGLSPDALNNTLYVRKPILLSYVGYITIKNLQVGDSLIDISYVKTNENELKVDKFNVKGNVEVIVED